MHTQQNRILVPTAFSPTRDDGTARRQGRDRHGWRAGDRARDRRRARTQREPGSSSSTSSAPTETAAQLFRMASRSLPTSPREAARPGWRGRRSSDAARSTSSSTTPASTPRSRCARSPRSRSRSGGSVMDVNVASMFLACRAVVPAHARAGWGQDREHLVGHAVPRRSLPAPLRHEQGRDRRAQPARWRRELGKDEIHVNCVAPGFTMSRRASRPSPR